MTTQSPTLVTMDEATSEESVVAYLEELLSGTGWNIDRVRRRSSRLEPPDSYWSMFSIDINKDEEERNLRLVAKGALHDAAWQDLSARLMQAGAGRGPDPISGLGYPTLFPESRHAYWFYPFDPTLSKLPLANDPVRIAHLLMGLESSPTRDILGAARLIDIERVRYVPEIGAILRYTVDAPGFPAKVYGKVQPGNRAEDVSSRAGPVADGGEVPRAAQPPAPPRFRR